MKRILDSQSQAKITRNRPPESTTYYLVNSTLGRFPPDTSGWPLDPVLEMPEGAPDGVYQVKYQDGLHTGRTVPTSFVPTIELRGGSNEAAAQAAVTTKATAALSAEEKDLLLNDPDHRRNLVEYRKYQMALDLEMKQAGMMHNLKQNADMADMMRMCQYQRLEMQAMAGFVRELQTESVRGSLHQLRTANEVLASNHDGTRLHREALTQLSGPAPAVDYTPVMLAGLSTVGRAVDSMVGHKPDPKARGRDAPVEAVFSEEEQTAEEAAQQAKDLAAQTRTMREEINRLRKEASTIKPPPADVALLAELRAMRSHFEKSQAEIRIQTAQAVETAQAAMAAMAAQTAASANYQAQAPPGPAAPAAPVQQSAQTVQPTQVPPAEQPASRKRRVKPPSPEPVEQPPDVPDSPPATRPKKRERKLLLEGKK